MSGLPGPDLSLAPEEVAELVRPREEHHLGERIDLERQVLVPWQVNDLGLEVHCRLGVGVRRRELEQLAVALRLAAP